MIKSFNVAISESEIAMYAGMVTSAFAFCEFGTGVLWGKLSDRVGRKPILLGGMLGTGISILMFGFSKNLPMALVARALGGLLNGYAIFPQSDMPDLSSLDFPDTPTCVHVVRMHPTIHLVFTNIS